MFRRRQQSQPPRPALAFPELAEQRSLGDRLRATIADQGLDITRLSENLAISRRSADRLVQMCIRRDRRITELMSANDYLGEQLAAAQKDAERARETVFMLGNAANHRQQQHEEELGLLRARLAEARRPLIPSDDPDPTGPLLAADDLYVAGWQSRSSAGQSAPGIGEVL